MLRQPVFVEPNLTRINFETLPRARAEIELFNQSLLHHAPLPALGRPGFTLLNAAMPARAEARAAGPAILQPSQHQCAGRPARMFINREKSLRKASS